MLFHEDNAPFHTSVIAMAKINELKFKLLPHARCSPDLVRSDYFLFPNLKKWLSDRKFDNNEEERCSSHYKRGIEANEHRW